MKSKGRQERECPIDSELLGRSPLSMTGTSSRWGAWEKNTHPRGEGVGVFIHRLPLSLTTGFSCVRGSVRICACVCVHMQGGGISSLTLLACLALCEVGSVRKRKPSGRAAHEPASGSWTVCTEEEGEGEGVCAG